MFFFNIKLSAIQNSENRTPNVIPVLILYGPNEDEAGAKTDKFWKEARDSKRYTKKNDEWAYKIADRRML